jgi:hypothetical protein
VYLDLSFNLVYCLVFIVAIGYDHFVYSGLLVKEGKNRYSFFYLESNRRNLYIYDGVSVCIHAYETMQVFEAITDEQRQGALSNIKAFVSGGACGLDRLKNVLPSIFKEFNVQSVSDQTSLLKAAGLTPLSMHNQPNKFAKHCMHIAKKPRMTADNFSRVTFMHVDTTPNFGGFVDIK